MIRRSSTSSSESADRTLRRFLLCAGAMAAAPLILFLAAYMAMDPFKVLRWHEAPFEDRLGLNKGMLSVQAYERGGGASGYDSFIMGSSVSCAYSVEEWKSFLPDGARPLHMDSSSQTVSTLRKFLEYLERDGASLRNVLVVFAPEVFGMEYDGDNLSQLVPPVVENGGLSYDISFHCAYFMGFANYRYLSPFLEYKFAGKREDSTDVLVFSPQPIVYDASFNEESMPDWDMILDSDPALLHGDGMAILPPDASYRILDPKIDAVERADLEAIAEILSRNGTDYRVLLAPTPKLYLLSDADERVLVDAFGKRFVNLTRDFRAEQSDPSNFYDTIHYRPRLASRYMRAAYDR